MVKKFLIKAVQEISEDEFEAEEDKSFNEKKLKSQQKITSHFLPSSSRSSIKKYKPNNVKQKAFRKTLGEWVVSSLRPFSIVEDVKFREMVTILDPQITVISPRTLGRDIVKLFKVKKKELIKIELKERAKFVMNVVINK